MIKIKSNVFALIDDHEMNAFTFALAVHVDYEHLKEFVSVVNVVVHTITYHE